MAPKAGEHPLMSNRTLRTMYAGLASSRVLLAARKRTPGSLPPRAALAEAACWVAPLVGLSGNDVVFSCRADDLAAEVRAPAPGHPAAPHIPDGVARLYAAIGAGTVASHLPSRPTIVAFFERHEAEKPVWTGALSLASALPMLLIVLPRWRGRDTPIDLGKLARAAEVPGIPVDAQDPIALYRVAQESLTRARAGGGAALLEAVHLPGSEPAASKLAAYLLHRKVATQAWIDACDLSGSGLPKRKKQSG